MRFHCNMIWLMGLIALLSAACGPSAPEYQPSVRSGVAPISTNPAPRAPVPMDQASEAETPASQQPAGSAENVSTPTPAPTPAPAPVQAIRTMPSAAEKTAMTNLYAAPNNQGGCAACHGALNVSEKKGRTAQQIAAAQTIIQHRTVAAANRWPKDTPDTSQDGVDNAQLFLSAMVEILK